MPNHLRDQQSPYLQQHADNPVDWYPYGPAAFERARAENKPILISIGYAACHWCHVMAHESFEDEAVADLMNRWFINVKVDREERPDVDSIYMEAVQALTGRGGWPLNVFVTPDGRPFFGGTYFPPRPHPGLPSWTQILEGVARAYGEQRDDVVRQAEAVTEYIEKAQDLNSASRVPPDQILSQAWDAMLDQFDPSDGGFGPAPKFPQPLALEFALRRAALNSDEAAWRVVTLTLDRMAAGGIFDHLGGGFHRYSVDAHWVVPHFEKMLYDNALLARLYLDAFQATGETRYRTVTEATLDYLLRDLRSPQGAFYASQDADSEGEEGRYYVWTPAEVERVLGSDLAAAALLRYGITPDGNFEGRTILTLSATADEVAARLEVSVEEVERRLLEARVRLLEAREQRVPPPTDTKILVAWNALVIRALAQAGSALQRSDYLDAARTATEFILGQMRPNGRLVRSYHRQPGDVPAFLEDYAYLIEALIGMYEASSDPGYLREAQDLAEIMVGTFWDHKRGAFFDVPADMPDLLVRPRGFFDNPIPSGNSAATFGLLRLHGLTGDVSYMPRATAAFEAVGDLLARAPLAFGYLLCALDFYRTGPTQVAVIGDAAGSDAQALAATTRERYLPNGLLAVGEGGYPGLLAGRNRVDGRATAYVCRDFTCRLPVTTPVDLARQLESARLTASGE